MADLSIDVCGIQFKNPVLLASGIWGETGATLARAARSGAGGVVTKSVGLEPRTGYNNPTVVEVDTGVINAVGLSNPGIEDFGEEVKEGLKGGGPVIGSVVGGDARTMADVARTMASYGVAAVELNLGCPHAKGLGSELGSDPMVVKEVTSTVKAVVKVPVFVKITPNVTDIQAIAKAVQDGGGDAVVAINTVRAMAISAPMARPVLHNGTGGYSGRGIKPIGLACVWQVRKAVTIPIIGVGGIMTGEDVAEYIMAGATCVQVGTVLQDRGEGAFKAICRELSKFMDKNGYETVHDMVGIAHK